MMKTIYTDLVWCSVLALVFATVMPTAALAENVVFPDVNLENVVRDKLGIPAPTPITDTDMETMRWLYAEQQGISNIEGLEYATNLTGLTLYKNQISDISTLSGMTKMTLLFMGSNQISDIAAVSGLTNLDWLILSNNQISDISALSEMTKMTELHLSYNQISDISAVSGMTKLLFLYLSDNQISDISAVSGLTNLSGLTLMNNQIETMDLSGSDLSSLRWFKINDNPLKKVLLADATLSQSTFETIMYGGPSHNRGNGVADVGGVLTLDMSGVDFAGLLDLSSMYGLDDLEELLLAGAINLDGSDLCLLTGELDSLNWLDITGAWDGFDMVTQDRLNLWDAEDGNTLVIPEPCSLVLLGLGALVLRRRGTA